MSDRLISFSGEDKIQFEIKFNSAQGSNGVFLSILCCCLFPSTPLREQNFGRSRILNSAVRSQ